MFNPLIASVICCIGHLRRSFAPLNVRLLASLIVQFLDSRLGTKPSSVREKRPVLLAGIADARIRKRASSRFVPREEILQARPVCKNKSNQNERSCSRTGNAPARGQNCATRRNHMMVVPGNFADPTSV
jgi:hypothetical protein